MCFTDDICDSTNVQATTSWQYLESPNYPNYYPSNQQCGTNIRGSGPVELEIVEVELETNYDYVWIYNQEYLSERSEWSRNVELTGSYGGGANYKSLRDTIYVNFTSDSSVNKKGFRFKFRQYGGGSSGGGSNGGSTTQSKHIQLHNIQSFFYVELNFLG